MIVLPKRRSDVPPRTPDLRQECGRLVARLRRQIEKGERLGWTAERHHKVRFTTRALILVERRVDDPLKPAGVVTNQDLIDRLKLLEPGAGLEVAS